MKTYFIAGTDTDVGKTYVTVELLRYLKERKLSTLAIKPIASGCEKTPEGLRNADALQLQKHATCKLPYDVVNPLSFEAAVAPHIAARNSVVDKKELWSACQPALKNSADICLIEGAGGWLTPLNETETLADAVQLFQCPVILVVGIRLGCLNHALLTTQAILNQGIPLAGWVANCIDPDMLERDNNIALLEKRIPAPCLARVGYNQSIKSGEQLLSNLL